MTDEQAPATGTSNLLYAASYSALVGSGVLAVFFLVRDSILGSPLMTPSILGAGIFGPGVPAGEVAIRLDWVAMVSFVHLALFAVVGAPFAYLVHRVPGFRERGIVLSLALFGALGVGVGTLDALFAPGLVQAVGPLSIALGNAVTAAAMAFFYQKAYAS